MLASVVETTSVLTPSFTALITISTRAALKRHHTYNLVLGVDTGVGTIDWSLERIGTEAERLEVDRELAQLREQLSQVEQWKKRREEIERELSQVWVAGEEKELEAPDYLRENGGNGVHNKEVKEEDVMVVSPEAGSDGPGPGQHEEDDSGEGVER